MSATASFVEMLSPDPPVPIGKGGGDVGGEKVSTRSCIGKRLEEALLLVAPPPPPPIIAVACVPPLPPGPSVRLRLATGVLPLEAADE